MLEVDSRTPFTFSSKNLANFFMILFKNFRVIKTALRIYLNFFRYIFILSFLQFTSPAYVLLYDFFIYQ